MRAYQFQVWFNIIKDNVEEVSMIGTNDKAQAFEIINLLLCAGFNSVKLRDEWGQWTTHKIGGSNGN